MTPYRGLASFLLAFVSLTTFAQIKVTDSLEFILPAAKQEQRVDVLNQLVYEFISVDHVKVVRYSDEALTLSRKIGYVKGEAVAQAYRGVYEYFTGQFGKARVSLHTSLRLSRRDRNKLTEGYALLQLGNLGLEEVNMDSAYFYLRGAQRVFADSTHPENLSKVYRNMSALFGQRFQPDSQQYYLDKAIAIRRLLPDKSYLVDALAIQANNKLFQGNIAGAAKLLDEADDILKLYPNDLENLNDVRHVRALVYFRMGEFEQASTLFDSARSYYFRQSIFRKYVTLLTDLGRIFSDRGEYELALNNLYDALQLSSLKGFETETYIIRTRIGWINFRLGDYEQALRLVNETLVLRPKKLLKEDLANALMLKGVVSIELNRLSDARAALDTVAALHKGAHNTHGLSEALLNFGMLESKSGNLAAALNHYKESLALADSSGFKYGQAWAAWGVADVYYRMKNFREASRYLDQSEKIARLTHANEVLILNYNTRRDLLRSTGNFSAALEYSIAAGEMKDSLRRSDLARRFVNLEKMQEIGRRDRDIRVLQQEKQLAEDKIHLQESRLTVAYISVTASFIITGLLIFIYIRIRKLNKTITGKNHAIEVQAGKLVEVNRELNQLYKELSEQNEEIQAQAQELSEINRNVTDINRTLEQLIAEKTVELRRTNEELVKHNNELLQFSYTVSHNLRGPVARLLGLTALMPAEDDLGRAREISGLINKTAGELDLIIRDLSKILELRRESQHLRDHVDLQTEWRQAVSLLQENLDGTEHITCDFSEIPELVTVKAMIQSAFYNLISNALKFRSPDRPLTIHAKSETEAGMAVITVADNGLGLDTTRHKEKLFRLYTRFHTHVEGRGLGLYLVKSQLEMVHGSISVDSTPGHGTRFFLKIPLKAEVAQKD